MLPWNRCKRRLAALWMVGGALIFLLLVVMTAGGKFSLSPNGNQDAWGWFMSSTMPSLSVIVSALFSETGARASKARRNVDATLYSVAIGLSAFYLLAVLGSLAASSVPTLDVKQRGIVFIHLSSLWLAPLQALVSGALGFFFMKTKTD